jgi:hypothetical protein
VAFPSRDTLMKKVKNGIMAWVLLFTVRGLTRVLQKKNLSQPCRHQHYYQGDDGVIHVSSAIIPSLLQSSSPFFSPAYAMQPKTSRLRQQKMMKLT